VLLIDRAAESYDIENKITNFNSTDEFNIDTKATNITSSTEVNIESSMINTTGDINQQGNMTILGNTQQTGNVAVTGQLATTGPTFLAGGANPLIYDIVLTIGTGNLGAPVVSSNIVLKTVLTKAS
jgi:hypothetical protein